jgi:serine/threonine-protein kinase RsbW
MAMTDLRRPDRRTPRVRAAAEVLGAVQRLGEDLAAAERVGDIGEVLAREGRGLTGAAALVFAVPPDGAGEDRLVLCDGVDKATAVALVAANVAQLAGLGEPHQSRPVVVTGLEIVGVDGAATDPRSLSWALVPLLARGKRIGILGLGWQRRRRFSAPFEALLSLIGHQFAMALDRALVLEADRHRRATSELVAEASRLMVSALDPDEIVLRLAKLAVPRLAPWCAVYASEGGLLRRVALEIDGAPALVDRAREFSTIPIDAHHPLAVAYRTGELQIVPEVTEEIVKPIYSGALAAELLATRTHPLSAIAVPVTASGRAVGVMSLVSDTWEVPPGLHVIQAAEALASQAGIALGVAGRFQREHETAAVLTHALLPNNATLPGFETASRYLPAGGTVAGDWFDVFRAGPGRFLIGVGDAGGHGIHAASLMAELRNAARGLAAAGHSPADILTNLGWLVSETEPDGFATALYAIADPTSGLFTWASAGHVPPVHFDRTGARFLEHQVAAPLGTGHGRTPSDRRLSVDVGSGLVLFTDGVVERRNADVEERLAVLVGLVERHREKGANRLVDLIADRLCADREDDCCILVLRRQR